MAGAGDRDLLGEWHRAVQQAMAAAASPFLDADQIGRLMAPQAELLQTLLDQQDAFRAELVERMLAPLERFGDLLDEVAEPMRRQVQAIQDAAAALERVAAMLDEQLALVDRARVAWRERAAAVRPLASSDHPGGNPSAP
jgi:hypothetical protein